MIIFKMDNNLVVLLTRARIRFYTWSFYVKSLRVLLPSYIFALKRDRELVVNESRSIRELNILLNYLLLADSEIKRNLKFLL